MTLLICVLITVSALFYIFYLPGKFQPGPPKTRLSYLRERKSDQSAACVFNEARPAWRAAGYPA